MKSFKQFVNENAKPNVLRGIYVELEVQTNYKNTIKPLTRTARLKPDGKYYIKWDRKELEITGPFKDSNDEYWKASYRIGW